MRHDFSTKFSPIWSPFCLFTCWKKGHFYPQYTSSHMISKYGRHVINRRPLHIVKKKKKKKSNGAQFTLCGFLGKSAYITEFSCQFCILNTSNFFGFLYPLHLCRRVYSFRLSVCPFVCSFVRSFVLPSRSWNLRQSFALKFLKWCISQQLHIRKHSYSDYSYPGGLAFTP